MENKLIFNFLKTIGDYSIYYCIPMEQRKLKCGMGRTCMFVMIGDEIVFVPKNFRSQYQALTQCENFIDSEIIKNE